jgi:N-acyl-D-aspartate/D-glutamate deacylase/Leucine-rich repeat (LRR) protein
MKWALLFALLLPEAAPAQQYDILIRGGLIVDGSGGPAFHGDIAIQGSKIAAMGSLSRAMGRRVVDAKGLVVAPGFIDIHNHSDYTVLKDGDAQSMVRQGVTSMILGEGGSAAPVGGKQPKAVEGEDWTDFAGYFARLRKQGVSTNIGTYVGSSQIWTYVHGEQAGPPSQAETEEMQALVRKAMEQGALGVASSLSGPPGNWIDTNTLVAMCQAAAPFGGIYSTHQRTEGKGVFESTAEAMEIGRRAGVPVDIIHLKIADHALWGKMPDLVAKILQARAAGQDVTANVYPYRAGQNNLSSIIPPWAHEGGVNAMLRRLKDPSLHARLVNEIEHGIPGSDWYDHYTATGSWEGMLLVSLSNPAYKRFEGHRMNEVIQALGGDPIDVLFRVLEDNRGSVPTIYFHHDEKDMQYALRQPFVSIGSDGSAVAEVGEGHPHPRYFGTFPRVLGLYVREQKVLTLEDAIRKMTSANAVKIRQYDRGLLRPGMWADVTVFDPGRIIDNATWEKPRQYATGVEYVLVNGSMVLDRGKHTGARPGMILYGAGFKHQGLKQSAAPKEPMSERNAAEWVIRAGGNLQIGGRTGIIRSVADLPGGEFHISAVDLVGTRIDPKELWNLSGMTELRELLLPGPSFNPASGSRLDANDQLAALSNLHNLEKLWFSLHFLSSINVQDKGLAHLSNLDHLRELRLTQTKVNGPSLAAFKNLEALDLSDTPFDDDGAQYLDGISHLRRLSLRNTLITDAALNHIAGLKSLESLDLYGTKVTDAGVQALSSLSKLRDLNILGSPITDESAEAIAKLVSLEDLNLYRTQITNAGLAKLQALRKLASLDIRYTRVTSSGVEAFHAAVPTCGIEFEDLTAAASADVSLRQSKPAGKSEQAVADWIGKMGGHVTRRGARVIAVDLSRTPVSDAQAAYLADLPAIEKLSLAGTQAGDGSITALSSLKKLHELDLSGVVLTDNGLEKLSGLPKLSVIRLNNTQLEGRGFSALRALPLEDVELSGSPVDDAGLSMIASLPSLRRLRLKYADITDAGAASLAKAQNLQLLDLNSTDVGDAALKHLSGLSELRELDLSYTRITNAGITSLANMQLEALAAARTRITDDAAEALGRLRTLKRLNLDYTAISDKGLKVLQAALPGLVELRLDSSGLTDASLDTLSAMKNLQVLNLYHTLVTEKAFETLKQALPQCRIIFDRDSALPNRRHS